MKILFVCWANVGRSQMAASFYNHLTNSSDAESAGTDVEMPGETLGERRKRRGGTFTIDAMAEEGIDVTGNVRTQLTPEMLENYDVVISMADAAYTPNWLSSHPRYISWVVTDPGGKGLAETVQARGKIKAKVIEYLGK